MVFPVVMYGCENWTIKKAECQRINAFEFWCWTRLLRVPWTTRRSNQLIFFFFFNFTILYWFCHVSTWICHRYTCVPHPEPSSLLPPCTTPLGHPSAPAPSIHYRASNLDWWLISYMILYMFQCHSPKSSHPLPLPPSPKDCSIHQCLFCCLVYKGYCYHLSKFHIYALVYCIGVFLSGLLHSV